MTIQELVTQCNRDYLLKRLTGSIFEVETEEDAIEKIKLSLCFREKVRQFCAVTPTETRTILCLTADKKVGIWEEADLMTDENGKPHYQGEGDPLHATCHLAEYLQFLAGCHVIEDNVKRFGMDEFAFIFINELNQYYITW